MKQVPAIAGGSPIRSSMLPYGKQWVSDEDIEEVVRVLKSDFLTQGPRIAEFEKAVADYVGVRYAVAFCNGTAALHGACFAADIGAGDEVITTPLTFAASSNCVLYQGGTPVFADVDPDTFLLDIEQVRKKITPRTKAIIPVDLTGQSVDMMAYRALADEHGLVFIQDGAHSLGASLDGRKVGAVADMTMFSFHPVKPITTGEGGIIVTNDERFYQRLQLFRTHGITREPSMLEQPEEGPWHYEMVALGYNYRMTDMQAVLGLSQMDKLDGFIRRRQEIAQLYDSSLGELEKEGKLQLPVVKGSSGWHLYIIRVSKRYNRRAVFEALRAENIGVNVHYRPVYLHPYYRQLGFQQGECPTAERLYESFISLPIFPKMTDEDVFDVVRAIERVVKYYDREHVG